MEYMELSEQDKEVLWQAIEASDRPSVSWRKNSKRSLVRLCTCAAAAPRAGNLSATAATAPSNSKRPQPG